MSRKCQLSGKKTSYGNTVSHSHRTSRRPFKVNLFKKWVYISHENKWMQLSISARMLKTLNKKGVVAILKKNKQDVSILKNRKTRQPKKNPQKLA